MPVPEFITTLRAKIGHDLLWMPGVSAVVYRDDGAILLGQRSDNGLWATISGIPDPGEEPAVAIRREIEEETGVVADVESLASIRTTPAITHENGDIGQYMNVHFVARYVSGHARVADDESLDVGWFDPNDLPQPLGVSTVQRIQDAQDFLANPGAGPILTR